MPNKSDLALLFSYAFLRKAPAFIDLVLALSDHCRVMIDSGAFSNHQAEARAAAKGSTPDLVTLDEYSAFCHRAHGHVWQYVALDVLGDADQTKVNLDAMVDDGLLPMPVFVRGDKFETAQRLVEINPFICCGGTVGVKGDYAKHRYQQIDRITNGKAKIHALGFIQLPTVFQLPIYSCDASSWMAGGRWGNVVQYDPRTFKMNSTDRKRMSKPTDHTRRTMAWLSRCGITYEQLSDPKSWRTDKGVPSYCSVYSYLRLQQHAAALKSERVIFMAIPDQLWLHNLMAVRAVSPTGGAFDYWRSLQVRAHLDALKGGNIDEYHEVMCNIAKAPGSMA